MAIAFGIQEITTRMAAGPTSGTSCRFPVSQQTTFSGAVLFL